MNRKSFLKFFVLVLILLSMYITFVDNFKTNFSENRNLNDLKSFVKENSQLINLVLLKDEGKLKFFNLINDFENPVILLDFDGNPLIWNNAATIYKGEFEKSLDIVENGEINGTIAISENLISKVREKDHKPFVLVTYFVIFFLLLYLKNFNFNILYFVLSFWVMILGDYSPLLLYLPMCILMSYFKNKKYIYEYSSIFHLLFHLYFLYKLLNSQFNFFSIITGSILSPMTFWIVLFLISCSFLYFSKISKLTFFILIISVFISFKLPILAFLIIILKKSVKKPKFSGHFFQALVFSILSVLYFYSIFYYDLNQLIKEKPLIESQLEEEAGVELQKYLSLAESNEYNNLLDFVKKTKLDSSKYDFEIAYFNKTGTINEVYTKGLPEMLSIPQDIVIEEVIIANTVRRIVAGTAKFKSGLITLRISADYLNLPYLKSDSPYSSSFQLVDSDGNKQLKIKKPTIFYFISDISYLTVLLLIIFLVVYPVFNVGLTSLFEKALVRYFTGFALITVFIGSIVIFYSTSYINETNMDRLKTTSESIKAIVDEYSEEISDNYLKWLGTLFNCDLSVYKNSELVSSSNNLENSIFLPYYNYFQICSGNALEMDNKYNPNGMFIKLKSEGFFCSVLYVDLKGISKTNGKLSEIARLFFITIFLMLSASFIITRVFTGKVVSPILDFVSSTEKIADGNYNVNIQYNEEDELGTLANSINHMANAISDNYDNLISLIENLPSAVALLDELNNVVVSNTHFSNIHKDVKNMALKVSSTKSERHFINGEHYLFSSVNLLNNSKVIIVENVSEVVKVSRLTVLTDMARKISHDIKNPLTPIKLNTEYLQTVSKKQPERLPEIIPKISENILNKIGELKGISEAFSALIKNEAIDNKEEFSLINFLTSHLSSYPQLKFNIIGEDIKVRGIQLKLARVIGNLIENSINFANDSTIVNIKISDVGEFAEVIYEDNGAGIPDENIESVFEPYFSTRETGTGLGLFIVREFMEESGGSIKALKSDKGAKFILNFRKA